MSAYTKRKGKGEIEFAQVVDLMADRFFQDSMPCIFIYLSNKHG